ncbi:MAG: SMC-Scp complex subunit ScpB [Candidatus Korobacteraceae bacterium]|jgi:segregation and condensation protein B
MGLKAKIEAVIYAAEEPITLEQISLLVKDIVLAEEAEKAHTDSIAESELPEHVATPEADGAPASDADESTEPMFVADTSQAAAVSQPDGFAEEAAAEVNEISEAEAAPAEALTAEVATQTEPEPQASVTAPDQSAGKHRKPANPEEARVRLRVRGIVEELIADYSSEEHGMEIRQVAGGYRMATKPEHHDVVRAFARSLKPPVRLSLAALETLAVIAYKQPVTAPEISEIRGVEAAGVLGTLLDRKLITTAGRKQVIGRPILYKTSKQFLMRFGLNELSELPSMEEFEKLAIDGQVELFTPSPQAPASEEPQAPALEEAPEESSTENSEPDDKPAGSTENNS